MERFFPDYRNRLLKQIRSIHGFSTQTETTQSTSCTSEKLDRNRNGRMERNFPIWYIKNSEVLFREISIPFDSSLGISAFFGRIELESAL